MADTIVSKAPPAENPVPTQANHTVEGNADNGTQMNGETAANDTILPAAYGGSDGDQIRRQVEYYFSDENLPTDMHLLQCCSGRENIGVSISRICGFKKMRKYKKKNVVEELRKSTFLEVSEDGKTVKRMVPLVGRTLLDPPEEDDGEIAYDPRTKREVLLPVPLLSQKKVECPPGMTKNMMKPTGFEDAFVEGPIKPDEAEEDMSMYDPDKPFVGRIEIAIQRFKQKRRMHEKYAKIFSKWMCFGGVESSPRICGRLSKADMAEMNSEEIARATATYNVPWDRGDEECWVVDFVGVGEAFLSSFYPTKYGYAPDQVKVACQVLRSFYNYLMVHDVCPEFNEDLLAARKVCDKAELELSKIFTAGLVLPDAFNLAASTVFGGSQAGTYSGDRDWAQDLNLQDIGMRDEEARITFNNGVAILGTAAQFELLSLRGRGASDLKVTQDEYIGLEVILIQFATEETKALYASQNEVYKSKLQLQPLGKLACIVWNIDNCNEYDLPKTRYPHGQLPKVDEGKIYEFWIEDRVLSECFEGMKMDARVRTLEGGITILDEVREVMCSFWKWLPNELWMERHPREFKRLKKGLEDVIEDMADVTEDIGFGGEKNKGTEMSDDE